MSNAFTVIATCRAKPGQEARLLNELLAMVEPSLAESGCMAYQPLVDPKDPHRVVIIEEWADRKSFDAHFETPHFRKLAALLPDVLAEQAEIRFYSVVLEP